jgi:hypothetical protein
LLLTITGNIFLPIMYLYAEKTNNTNLQKKMQEIYNDFPALSKNTVTSFMQGYFGQEFNKLVNANYINQQGLMNIYYRFCNYRMCELCNAEKRRILNAM